MMGDKAKTAERHKFGKDCTGFSWNCYADVGEQTYIWEMKYSRTVFDVISGFAKLYCFEGERTVLSNNGKNNLFILSWFLD